jgi:tetratricopeptide (TPR) repeat protein
MESGALLSSKCKVLHSCLILPIWQSGIIILFIILSLVGWRSLKAVVYERQAANYLAQIGQEFPTSGGSFACLSKPVEDPVEQETVRLAIDHYQKALQFAPDQAHLLYRLGQIYCLVGDYRGAATALEHSNSLRLHNPQAFLELGFALEKLCPPLGFCVDGVSAVKTWQETGVGPYHFIENGETAGRDEKYQEAVNWYQRAQNMGMDLTSTILYTEFLLLEEAQDGDKSVIALTNAIEIDSGWVNEATRFRAWYHYGRIWFDNENWLRAEEILQRAVDIHPGGNNQTSTLSDAYRYLARAQLNLNKHELALPNYKKAVEVYPRNIWGFVSYGRGLLEADKSNISLALEQFKRAIELAGKDYVVWRNIINILLSFDFSSQAASFCDLAVLYDVDMTELRQCPIPQS